MLPEKAVISEKERSSLLSLLPVMLLTINISINRFMWLLCSEICSAFYCAARQKSLRNVDVIPSFRKVIGCKAIMYGESFILYLTFWLYSYKQLFSHILESYTQKPSLENRVNIWFWKHFLEYAFTVVKILLVIRKVSLPASFLREVFVAYFVPSGN